MQRRDFLRKSVALGAAASAIPLLAKTLTTGGDDAQQAAKEQNAAPSGPSAVSLPKDPIPVAFVISKSAVVIDFCGPWEVFQDASPVGSRAQVFNPFTVAETLEPVVASAGLRILPDYTFQNAPKPKIIVIPAQRGQTEAMLQWIRTASKTADLTMSVCVGANVLAATGLLSGRPATIHHNSYAKFATNYPDIHVKRGVRYVDDGNIATAGGLTSGIDLALHVVERYLGPESVKQTTYYMEYFGDGWKNPNINAVYDEKPISFLEKACDAFASRDV